MRGLFGQNDVRETREDLSDTYKGSRALIRTKDRKPNSRLLPWAKVEGIFAGTSIGSGGIVVKHGIMASWKHESTICRVKYAHYFRRRSATKSVPFHVTNILVRD
jgi:hypothetical protein